MRLRRILMTLCLLASPLALRAALPQQMNYQGRLANSGGAVIPSGSTFTVNVLIYDAVTGGTLKWSETHSGVATTSGLFNVVLGSITPINLPFDQPYFLTINVNGTGEMTPRTPLTTAPYAFRAAYADAAQVSAPLSLTSTNLVSALHVANTNGGPAADFNGVTAVSAVSNQMPIYAKNTLGGGFYPAILGEASGTGVGVIGRNTGTGGAGGLGGSVAPAFYTGVGVYGGAGGTGFGAIGEGQNGVLGKVTRGAGVAVRADANSLPGATALQVVGDATFDGVGNTTTFNSFVSFTAGTNLGAASLAVPLNLTGGLAFPATVFKATNTRDGYGISGVTSQPGGFAGAGPPDFSSAISAGVRGYTNVSNSAGVAGYSEISNTAGLGVMGVGMTGVGGFGRTDIVGARGGDFSADGPGGLGLNVSASNGQGATIYSQLIGISVSASGASGTGIYSNATLALDANGALALRAVPNPGLAGPSQGRIYFDSTTNQFKVSENGGTYVNLLGGSLSAPLSLTGTTNAATLALANSGGGSALYVTNSSGSSAIEAHNGGTGSAIYASNSGFGSGIYGDASAGSQAGVSGRSSNSGGFGVYAQNIALNNGTALKAEATGTGGTGTSIQALGQAIGISATATGTGVAGQFIGPNGVIAYTSFNGGRAIKATQANGTSGNIAIDALATGTGGVGVQAIASSGAGSSKGLIAEGGYIGVSAVGGASGTGTGVYAAGAIALLAQGSVDLLGTATAPTLPSVGTGRIYFDKGSNKFRVSEDGTGWADLVASSNQFVQRSGDSMTGTLNLPLDGLAVGPSQLYVTSGRLGVGTNTPGAALDLQFSGTGADGLRIQGTSGSAVPGLRLYDAGGTMRGGLSYDPTLVTTTLDGGGQLAMVTSGTERMRISNLGNIGMGTNSPNSILDLNGALTVRGIGAPTTSFNGQGRIYFDSTTNKFKVSENAGAYKDLVSTVVAPLSLTSTSADSALYAVNTATGSAVYGFAGSSILGSGVVGSTASSVPYSATNKASVFGYTAVNEGLGVLGLNSYGSGVGVLGAVGPSVPTVISGNRIGVIGSSRYYSGNAIGVYGEGANAGVVGTTDTFPGSMPSTVAVYGSSSSGVGVWGKSSNQVAVVAEGTSFGLSATASTGVAVYARTGSTSPAIQAINDNSSSGTGVFGVGTGAGTGVKGQIVSPVSGSVGVYGINSDSASYGVQAENIAATAAAGGAALFVKGPMKVANSLVGQAGPNFTINAPNGSILQTGTGTAQFIYSVTNSFVLPDSIVVVSFSNALATTLGAYGVRTAIGGGKFFIEFANPVTLQNSERINFMIINQD